MIVVGQPRYTPTRGAGWVLILVGILAIAAGVLPLVFPRLTLLELVLRAGRQTEVATPYQTRSA